MVPPHTVDSESPTSPRELDLPGWPSLARPNSRYPLPLPLHSRPVEERKGQAWRSGSCSSLWRITQNDKETGQGTAVSWACMTPGCCSRGMQTGERARVMNAWLLHCSPTAEPRWMNAWLLHCSPTAEPGWVHLTSCRNSREGRDTTHHSRLRKEEKEP